MAHQAKFLTTLGAGVAIAALAAVSGNPALATDRTTGVTQSKLIVLAKAEKRKKKKTTTKRSTKSKKRTTRTKRTAPPREKRGSY